MVYTIRSQLIAQLQASAFVQNKGPLDLRELNMNSNNWACVKGVLVAALYPNVCGVDHEKNALFDSYCSKVAFHSSTTLTKKKSALEEISTEWIVFDEMTKQVPVDILAIEAINIHNIRHQVGFPAACNLPMHGREGRAIIACFLRAKDE